MPATTSESLKPKAINDVPVKPEEAVAPSKPEVKPAADQVTINLQQAHYNVMTAPEAAALGWELERDEFGKQYSRVKFGPGEVTVSKDMAEDLLRREREIQRADNDRIAGTQGKLSGHIAQIG